MIAAAVTVVSHFSAIQCDAMHAHHNVVIVVIDCLLLE